MSKVQPSYNTPCGNTVKKYLQLEYLHEKAELKSDLQHAVALSLTCDTWSSSASQGYLTATGHHITEDWVLKHAVLGTKRMIGRHTGEHIYACLASIEQEYGVANKIIGVTSDNASNMKAAASRQVFMSSVEGHVQCFAHTLQLAVEDGLKQDAIQKAAASCRKLVGHFNRSTLASDGLESYQKTQGQKPLKLVQDVPTRWNSLYFMFERLEKLRTGIYCILHDKKFTKTTDCEVLELAGCTWTLIEQLLPTLQPLVDATEVLSSEDYPSVSSVMPMLCLLIQNDLQEAASDSAIIRKVKNDIILGLVKRFTMPGDEHYNTTLQAVASFLDPRYKTLKYIQNVAVQSQVKSFVLHLMRLEMIATNVQPSPEEPPTKMKKTVLSYLEGDYTGDIEKNDPEEELVRYQAEPVLIRNPLDWWKHYEKTFPTLGRLAKKFLCVMGTSIPSERVFSIAGLTVTSNRAKLDAEVVDEIIFLNKILDNKFN